MESTVGRLVLQRTSEDIKADRIEWQHDLLRQLDDLDVPVPSVQATRQGAPYFEADGWYWQAFEFVPTDGYGYTTGICRVGAWALGNRLGQLHAGLENVAATLKISLVDSVHDVEQHAAKLQDVRRELAPSDILVAGTILDKIDTIQSERELLLKPSQLIHGDPKMNNILVDRFADGSILPKMFIDYDSAFYGAPLQDVGDMMRSIQSEVGFSGDHHQDRKRYSETLISLLDGYSFYSNMDSVEMVHNGWKATEMVAAELACRYACDSIENRYFKLPFTDAGHYSQAMSRARKNLYIAQFSGSMTESL